MLTSVKLFFAKKGAFTSAGMKSLVQSDLKTLMEDVSSYTKDVLSKISSDQSSAVQDTLRKIRDDMGFAVEVYKYKSGMTYQEEPVHKKV